MDADFKKIKKYVKFMRDNGVLTLDASEIKLSISPSSIFHDSEKSKTNLIDNENISTDAMSPEDLMLWSAPGIVSEAEN